MIINQNLSSRQKIKDSFVGNWIMDGIAIYFLGRALFPILRFSLDGYRLSFILLPVWLFMAYRSGSGHQMWKSVTGSRGFFVGICGYSIWLVLEMLIKRSPDAGRDIGWLIITALPVYLMGCFYGYLQPDRFWRIVRILLVILGIQAAYSIPFLISGVWNAKVVMNGVDYDTAAGKLYMIEAALHGIGGYDLYMNTAVLVSIVSGFALYKRRGWITRSFWVLSCAFILLASIESTFSASALVATLGTVVVLIIATVSGRLALSTLLIFFLMTGLIGGLVFNKVLSSDQYAYTTEKLSNIIESVDNYGLKGETTGRGERIFMSINAFLESPLVGYGAEGSVIGVNSQGGGHSTWLNTLVQYGVLGGFWFFLMVFSVGKQLWKAVKMRPGDLLAISFMVAYISFLIYGIINVVMMDLVFFFILYGGALALQRQSRRVRQGVQAPIIQHRPTTGFYNHNPI
jgi:hypothetical protein